MLYLDEGELDIICRVISDYFTKKEEVPDYVSEQSGIDQLLGVFERVQMEHYISLVDKVAFLFIQINKGHFFSNGNKRLALVSAVGFLFINDKRIASLSEDEFKEILLSIFPGCEDSLEDHDEFSSDEFALYNLSIIVADSHKYVTPEDSFDVLKEKVVDFFSRTIIDDSE